MVTQEARYQQRNKKPKGSKRKRLFQQPHCKAPHVMFEFEKNKSLRPTTATNKLRTRQEVLLVPWFFFFLRRKARGSIDRCRGDTLVTSAASMRTSSQHQQQQQHVPLSRITGISSRPRAPPPGFRRRAQVPEMSG